uniref:Uncharacterized protein n=3 Tax=Chaetoceros debilis TaxID=122233 RepID=A0A7S3QFM8_9STRA
MTVEEYLASKAKSSTSAAGEGLFGKMSLKTLAVTDEEFTGKAAHAVDLTEDFCKMGPGKSARKRKEKKEVKTLDLNFRVASTNAGGGDDRGDRGGDRGGRGGDRGGRGGDRGGDRGDRRGGGRGGRGGDRDRGDRRGGGRGGGRSGGDRDRGGGGRGGRGGGGRGGGNKNFALDTSSFPTL